MWQEAAVRGLILAVINPDNTPHGYQWTYAFPMLLFIFIAAILYLLFSRPHRRVPRQPISAAASPEQPAADQAHAAAVAGGLSLAPGGGTTESTHEPAGAHLVASTETEDQPESAGQAEPDGEGDGDAGGGGSEAHE